MRACTPKSSVIRRILFDDEAQTLTVTLRDGRGYRFAGVPRSVYDDFKQAPSAGRFFNDLKGRHPAEPHPPRRRYGEDAPGIKELAKQNPV